MNKVINKNIRWEIYNSYMEGMTEVKISKKFDIVYRTVARIVEEFRVAERQTMKANNERFIFEDNDNVRAWLLKSDEKSRNFVLITDNDSVVNAYNKMINP